jgi:hypothetical protein
VDKHHWVKAPVITCLKEERVKAVWVKHLGHGLTHTQQRFKTEKLLTEQEISFLFSVSEDFELHFMFPSKHSLQPSQVNWKEFFIK